MKFHSFSLFLKEAFKNILHNKVMSVATILTLAAGLFLFGITSALTLNIFSITEKLEKDFMLAAYLDETLTDEQIKAVGETIKSIPDVEKIIFESKEDAYEVLKERWGNTDILEEIDDGSILRDSYQIVITDLSKASDINTKLEEIEGVAKVSHVENEMSVFVDVTSKIQFGTIVISIILALLSMLIMTNTINMSIFARKKQIGIMKYVGATDWYIRWPFILEGMMIGLFSSLLSLIALNYIYNAVATGLGSYSQLIGFLTKAQALPFIIVIVISTGLILGSLASIFSIKKHLKV